MWLGWQGNLGEQGQRGPEQSGNDVQQLSWESDRELKMELRRTATVWRSPTAGPQGVRLLRAPQSLHQNPAEGGREGTRGQKDAYPELWGQSFSFTLCTSRLAETAAGPEPFPGRRCFPMHAERASRVRWQVRLPEGGGG